MTLEEMKLSYGSIYKAMQDIGLQYSNANYWKKIGYIPINTQLKIEKITQGRLIASLDDCRTKERGD